MERDLESPGHRFEEAKWEVNGGHRHTLLCAFYGPGAHKDLNLFSVSRLSLDRDEGGLCKCHCF